jgi:deoxyribodipyrimidine photolyase-related protein
MAEATGALPTVWVFGDQLNRRIGALRDREPGDCRVLLVESELKITSKRWHRQRLHLVLSAMRHFAAELHAEGFEVDHRQATSFVEGYTDHCADFEVERLIVMEPMSWDVTQLLGRLSGVDSGGKGDTAFEVLRNDQFFCHYDEFAEWASNRKSFKMEDFYRWQRGRFGVLMDGPAPAGGKWNYDHDNRERPPKDGRSWPAITRFELDDIDAEVISMIDALGDGTSDGDAGNVWGSGPAGTWPVTREQALTRLDEFLATGLEPFGPHEDAMLGAEWKLAHSVLSSCMNLGLLHATEVVEAAEAAFRERDLPLNSVEGFVRQVLGWREYVWCVYWRWMPGYRSRNHLGASRQVPPAFTGQASTEMRCVSNAMQHLDDHGYTHHIERLMVFGNLALTSGVDPWAMTEWMWASFVDGAEWVMLPNVIGMALHADGGMMATKPYASGGAYINKMSDSCKGCRFDPKKRTGDDACPFTTLYWNFLARNADSFSNNHRMGQQLAGMRRLSDLDAVRDRAAEVLVALDAGTL